MDLKLTNNNLLSLGSTINSGITTNCTTVFVKNCPNVSGITILRQCPNLTRVRLDIGSISGSLNELLQYSTLNGFNDSYETQTKPRLVGTWTVNDWYTSTQIAQAQAAFDGLTIVGDPNYELNFEQMVVQTLDSTKPHYNPALSILCSNKGWGTNLSFRIFNQGTYFLTTAQAAVIDIPSIGFLNTVKTAQYMTDSNCIVADSVANYNFDINCYIWKYFLLEDKVSSNDIRTTNYIKYFDIPSFVTEYGKNGSGGWGTSYSGLNSFFGNGYIHINRQTPAPIGWGVGSGPKKIYLGIGNKYKDNSILEDYYYSTDYPSWRRVAYFFQTWYDYCAPKITFDGSSVTMTVERDSEIYYTLDGTIPTSQSTHYTEPFLWDGVGVVKAVGIQTIDNIQYPVQALDFYQSAVTDPVITINGSEASITSEAGATIYYTTDGSYPSLESPIYSSPIQMSDDTFKIRCFATMSGKRDSEVVSKLVILNDLLWNTFALQCLDSSKPNYNPAACIVLENKKPDFFKLTDMVWGGGGYITKTDAATFNIGGSTTDWNNPFDGVKNATSTLAVKLLSGTYSFDSFDELKYFTATTTLGSGAFRNCTNLRSIALDNITVYGSGCFMGSGISGTIETNADDPGLGTFVNCTNLTKAVININAGHTSALNGFAWNNGYFSGSTNLEEVEVNENVTGFGSRCFSGCNKLEVVHLIGDTVKTIDTSVALPSLVKFYVGDGSSSAHDDALLADYLADSSWTTLSSRLDTWYNYLHPTT